MAFLSGKPKDMDKKQRIEQPKIPNQRGHALTEETEGFKDLYWS